MKELTGLRKKDFEAGAKEEREKIIRYLQANRWRTDYCFSDHIQAGEHNKCQ